MKNIILLMLVFSPFTLKAQALSSGIYPFDEPISKEKTAKMHFIGNTRDFETLSMESYVLPKKMTQSFENELMETLILVKTGKLKISHDLGYQVLGSGSVAVIIPGDHLEVSSEGPAEFYRMMLKPKIKPNSAAEATSFMVDWDELEYREHDKGGRRNFFDKETSSSIRMEMHATTLNVGLNSHDPHTHRAAEIILLIKGQGEMYMDGIKYKGKTGDIFFVESGVSHNITNIDNEPITYYAYQFE
jgi:(S)-ureidoglycine aminohydrolase